MNIRLLIACAVFVVLIGHAESAEPTKIWKLEKLSDIGDGEAFRYVGRAAIYEIGWNSVTIDDGSAFVTAKVAPGDNLGDLSEGELIYGFLGQNVSGIDKSIDVNWTTLERLKSLTQFYTAVLYPIVADDDDQWSEYPNRMVIFHGVDISEDAQMPDYYVATTSGGSKALIAKTQGVQPADDVCIVCTPRVDADRSKVYLDKVGVREPVQVVTSLSEIANLPYESIYRYEGDVVIYSHTEGLMLDDGDSFYTLGVEYLPQSQWPAVGTVVTGFSGRTKYEHENADLGGGRIFSEFVNGNSLRTTGEVRELRPIVAADDDTFDRYIDRIVTFRNVEISPNPATSSLHYFATLGNGDRAEIDGREIVGDRRLDPGVYETVTCIPERDYTMPVIWLCNVKVGSKAGVESIDADADGCVRYIDLSGRAYTSLPATKGVYIIVRLTGEVGKVVR